MTNLWTGISNHYQLKYTGCLGLLASSLESQFYLGFYKYRGEQDYDSHESPDHRISPRVRSNLSFLRESDQEMHLQKEKPHQETINIFKRWNCQNQEGGQRTKGKNGYSTFRCRS